MCYVMYRITILAKYSYKGVSYVSARSLFFYDELRSTWHNLADETFWIAIGSVSTQIMLQANCTSRHVYLKF